MATVAESGIKEGITGIILAGGRSRRLGRDKALEPFGGQPLIRRVIGQVEELADEIVVSVADAARASALPLDENHRVAVDVFPEGGSLGGIYAGLRASRTRWGLVVACDMPFLNRQLLEYMLSLRDGYDAVVPMPGDFPEPTHALYADSCLPSIEAKLRSGNLKIARFFEEVNVRYVDEEEVSRFDPGLRSFFNVNSPDDLAQARALSGEAS